MSIQIPSEDLRLHENLNPDQHLAFTAILSAGDDRTGCGPRVFFIDGPGGSGKTYLYRALLAHFRQRGQIALATASSGLAAIMMPGGRTAHSRFKLPVPITTTSTCKIGKRSGLDLLRQQTAIIIWDEATMSHRHNFEALDQSLRDITGTDALFGGKLVILGGDFRQVLPIVPQGSRTDIINASVRNSYIWDRMQIISLSQNMRALHDPDFSQFLLRIGNGTEPSFANNAIRLPEDMVLLWENENSLEFLISEVFPDLSLNAANPDYMINRAVLTTTNDHVDKINNMILAHFPGETHSYFSFDTVENDPQGIYQLEFLNSITQGSLPPHKLDLKIGAPIILTRNVNPRDGLCNGTRLLCSRFYPNLIEAEIVTGSFKGKPTFLHRIPLQSKSDMKLPFSFTRKQFPIRLSFALTIHKSQGQTIPFVGIYLPQPVFSHGQLYVALSRGKQKKNTRIMVK
ncbi:DNA helicase [Ranunculus cassubicifolius]